MTGSSDFRLGINELDNVNWRGASVGPDHKVTISGSFTHAGRSYEVTIKYDPSALAARYGEGVLDHIDEKVKGIVGRVGIAQLASLSGHTVTTSLGEDRHISLLRGGRQLLETEYGALSDTVHAIDNLFGQTFPGVRSIASLGRREEEDELEFSFTTVELARRPIGGVDDLIEDWRGLLAEWVVPIPEDQESQRLLSAAARLVRVCQEKGHGPDTEDLDLTDPEIKAAVKDLIQLARPYYQKNGHKGFGNPKCKFLTHIPECMKMAEGSWSAGLHYFVREVWGNNDRYEGVADLILADEYFYPALINSNGDIID